MMPNKKQLIAKALGNKLEKQTFSNKIKTVPSVQQRTREIIEGLKGKK
jgi:hypothetical protein